MYTYIYIYFRRLLPADVTMSHLKISPLSDQSMFVDIHKSHYRELRRDTRLNKLEAHDVAHITALRNASLPLTLSQFDSSA